MSSALAESTVEQTTLAWLESLGWAVRHALQGAPREPCAERADYREVVLAQRLREALLPKLISGELRVPDVEKIIEEA